MNDICSTIVAIVQDNRVETATRVQDVLTNYGCHIRVRLGLHDAKIDECSNTGVILLQMCADDQIVSEFEQDIKDIPNVRINHMTVQ